MEKESIKKLKWFLKFLALDLASLEPLERIFLAAETSQHMLAGLFGITSKSLGKEQLEGEPVAYSIFKKGYTRGIFTEEELYKNLGPDIYVLQKILRDKTTLLFERIEKAQKGEFYYGYGVYPLTEDETAILSVSVRFKVDENDKLNTKLQLIEEFNEGFQDTITLIFLRCLDAIPINAFHKCPECNHWFVNVSKKEKIYCSNRCASRYIVRKKRKSPEYRKNELDQGKKRARKSYEKKIRTKQPNAKIPRRPRKT